MAKAASVQVFLALALDLDLERLLPEAGHVHFELEAAEPLRSFDHRFQVGFRLGAGVEGMIPSRAPISSVYAGAERMRSTSSISL